LHLQKEQVKVRHFVQGCLELDCRHRWYKPRTLALNTILPYKLAHSLIYLFPFHIYYLVRPHYPSNLQVNIQYMQVTGVRKQVWAQGIHCVPSCLQKETRVNYAGFKQQAQCAVHISTAQSLSIYSTRESLARTRDTYEDGGAQRHSRSIVCHRGAEDMSPENKTKRLGKEENSKSHESFTLSVYRFGRTCTLQKGGHNQRRRENFIAAVTGGQDV